MSLYFKLLSSLFYEVSSYILCALLTITALSSNGKIMAAGAPWSANKGQVKIYRSDDLQIWTQLGQSIFGEANSGTGSSIALSSDGKTLAVGSPGLLSPGPWGNNSFLGSVNVYRLDENGFKQIGETITGKTSYDQAGKSVALSGDGRILAIGASGNSDSDEVSGYVKTYEWDDNASNYVQIGQPITAVGSYDGSGMTGGSLALSGNGEILAIGAPYWGEKTGQVRVYNWQHGDWKQLGDGISGKSKGDEFGQSVALSSDGKIVASGAPWGGQNSGYVGVLRLDESSNWKKINPSIFGEAADDRSANPVVLSSDGMTLAIGGTGNDSNTGHVRVFTLQ